MKTEFQNSIVRLRFFLSYNGHQNCLDKSSRMNSVFCCDGGVVVFVCLYYLFIYLFIYSSLYLIIYLFIYLFIFPQNLKSFPKQCNIQMVGRTTITKLHLLVSMAAVSGHEKKFYFDVILVSIIIIFSLLFIFF